MHRGADDRTRRLSVGDLIPASRLAAIGGDNLIGAAVCDGDDAYEVDLTGDGGDDDSQQSADDLGVERAFLKCVVGAGDASKVEDLITYARKNYWLGGKNIYVHLDVGKTILNRQTKLVLHNSKPRNSTNTPNESKPFKKTDFRLEEWPYASQNQPLITKGNEECELAPWMRSRNKRFSPSCPKPIDTAKYGTCVAQHEQQSQHYWKRRVPQHRRVFAAVPTRSADPPRQQLQIGRWPGDLHLYRQLSRFPIPPLQTPLTSHYRSRNRSDGGTAEAAAERDNFKCKNTMLQSTRHSGNLAFSPENNNVIDLLMMTQQDHSNYSKVNLVNDGCIEKIISTLETNNKDALRSFLCLLKHVFPKRLEEFDKIMTIMDYLNSQPPTYPNKDNRNVSSDQ